MAIPHKIKKMLAILMPAMFSAIGLVAGFMFYGVIGAIVGFAVLLVLFTLVSTILLDHPFRRMIEGTGILALNLDSAGYMKPFCLQRSQSMVTGMFEGKEVKTIWDLDSIVRMTKPTEVKNGFFEDEEFYYMRLPKKDLAQTRFGFEAYPTFIFNSITGLFITKDMISSFEKDTVANHTILMLIRQLDELSSLLRDFTRKVADLLQPIKGLFDNKIVITILIIGGIILLGVLAWKFLGSSAGSTAVSSAMTAVKGTQTITPMN